jgi:plasmid stability protein
MKTTLELPDDLMRKIRIRAAQGDRKLKDVVTELLRRGLAQAEAEAETAGSRHRVKLPLFKGRPAAAGQEATPDVVKQILADEENARYLNG